MVGFLEEYTLLRELGKGGFATVYKVRHNRSAMCRVLNETVESEDSPVYRKFLKECKTLLRLGNGNNPNIVHIYQPRLLANKALVEMDFVQGCDITHYLEDNGRFLPIGDVMRLAEQMSGALAYCHHDIYRFCMDPDFDDLQNDPDDGRRYIIGPQKEKELVDKYKVIHNDIHSGNIMRMYDGTMVEVVNTDAEGRLILADAIAYANRFKPQVIVDAATLTGAAERAIGKYGIVAMHQDAAETMEQIKRAGDEVYERIAEFPFWDEYGELIKSDVADIKNSGAGPHAGMITAGKFVAHFAKAPFVHLDIAGVAFANKDYGIYGKGATGFGVRLLYRWIEGVKNKELIIEPWCITAKY